MNIISCINDKSQHEFCNKDCTTSAAAKIIKNIYKALNNKDFVPKILLDVSKAFNSLSHTIYFLIS